MIATAVSAGRIFREHAGVYAIGKRATAPQERAMAKVLAGGRARAAARSGLWLWDLGELPR